MHSPEHLRVINRIAAEKELAKQNKAIDPSDIWPGEEKPGDRREYVRLPGKVIEITHKGGNC